VTYDFQAEGIDVDRAHGGPEVKTTCPKCSHTRKKATQKCLNVNLETGVFNCWHCGFCGKATDPRDQRKQPARVTSDKPKAYAKPVIRAVALTESAALWLGSRGLTKTVLERNRVTTAKKYMPQVGAEVTAIAFPYFRDGEVINCKYRDKDKNFCMESGAERLLYGLDDIGATTIIVEGEIAKLSV